MKYISLVNLIANREVVPEMMADRFTVDGIANELYNILPGQADREKMLAGYQEVRQALGNLVAPDNAARIMYDLLVKRREELLRLAKERAEAEARAAAEAAEKARQKALAEKEAAKKRAEAEEQAAIERAEKEARTARERAEAEEHEAEKHAEVEEKVARNEALKDAELAEKAKEVLEQSQYDGDSHLS